MFLRCGAFLLFATFLFGQTTPPVAAPDSSPILGFRDSAAEVKLEQQFIPVPSAALAGEELETLTAVPHIAGSKEDYSTALYVAKKFREAGLETTIVPYKVMMNFPKKIQVTAFNGNGKQIMSGPTPEHVSDDPYQNDPRIVAPFNAYSPSGNITAEVVYANYGRRQDFETLAAKHISVRGKIVIARYGKNFRGVIAYLAQQHGAAGLLIYSDPADDGYYKGDIYPEGPYRPETGVQRGTILYIFKYPGDPTTPGVASTPDLPAARRILRQDAANQPKIPATPLSYHDAAPILAALGGPESPRAWQGGLPFTYHIGPGPGTVHMDLQQTYALHTIWDVIGKIPGTEYPDHWVVVGNHRDAWVFGAVDPGSGTAAMLEAVHGMGALLKQGWKPKRTVLFASWDAEEQGLVGSTEWTEDHAAQLSHAVAYFNIDVGVSGPNFGAQAVPSLKPFLVSLTKMVPSPQGGTVYDAWLRNQEQDQSKSNRDEHMDAGQQSSLPIQGIRIGDLGSGSDYTPFLQHFGVPSTDIGSSGPYGVYHSAFDDYTWYIRFADPSFAYLQQQARVLGLEALRMANADLLPYNYADYGGEVVGYLQTAQKKASSSGMSGLNFSAAIAAAQRFQQAGTRALVQEHATTGSLRVQNAILRQTEEDLLSQRGLPNRPWYKHTIYAPGEYTGYAAVVIPGVNEAIDDNDTARAKAQLEVLTNVLSRAAATLSKMP